MTHRELLEIVQEARDVFSAGSISPPVFAARLALDTLARVIAKRLGDDPPKEAA